MIIREGYLNKLIAAKDSDYVKLVIGIRRSGKSTLLQLMRQHLLNNGVLKEQIIFINFGMMKHDKLKDGKNLHDYIESLIEKRKKRIYFLMKFKK